MNGDVEQVGLAEPQQQAGDGSTAIGSISARPSGCSPANLLFTHESLRRRKEGGGLYRPGKVFDRSVRTSSPLSSASA